MPNGGLLAGTVFSVGPLAVTATVATTLNFCAEQESQNYRKQVTQAISAIT